MAKCWQTVFFVRTLCFTVHVIFLTFSPLVIKTEAVHPVCINMNTYFIFIFTEPVFHSVKMWINIYIFFWICMFWIKICISLCMCLMFHIFYNVWYCYSLLEVVNVDLYWESTFPSAGQKLKNIKSLLSSPNFYPMKSELNVSSKRWTQMYWILCQSFQIKVVNLCLIYLA